MRLDQFLESAGISVELQYDMADENRMYTAILSKEFAEGTLILQATIPLESGAERPSLEGTIYCLCFQCCSVEGTEGFEDWVAMVKLPVETLPDMLASFLVYKETVELAERVRRFFGDADYKKLLIEIGPNIDREAV